MYEAMEQTPDAPKWQHHNISVNFNCQSCGTVLRAFQKGIRHHCRSCGIVICTDCKDKSVLNTRITERGQLERLKGRPGEYAIFSITCKACKIRNLIRDNAITKGFAVMGSSSLSSGAKSSKSSQQQKQQKQKQKQQSPAQQTEQRKAEPRHHNHNHEHNDEKRCAACGLGVPRELAKTFLWNEILRSSTNNEEDDDPASTLFCHRCAFSLNDHRGGLRAASVFVTRLSPNVIAEDLHATLEDHFGGVQRVHIPRGEDGKPKTDGDGFAFAQVFFYKTDASSSSSSKKKNEQDDEKDDKSRWSENGGITSCLKAGWCWNGISKGQRCRIHHGGGSSTGAFLPFSTGSIAVRSKMSLSNKVRHIQGDHGTFQSDAEIARERITVRAMALQTEEIREQQTKIFKFKDMQSADEDGGAGPFNLAKMACQHDDVHSMARLFKLNQQAVSYSKLRKELFDPYSLVNGRTLLHIACVHGSYEVLSLILSDAMLATAMTIRAQQQRVLSQSGAAAVAAPSVSSETNIFERAVNQTDGSGFSCLQLICLSNTSTTVKAIHLLLDRGADPNASTARGETALYFSAVNNNVKAVSALISVTEAAEAVVTLKTLPGVTPEVERLLKDRIRRN